MKTVENNIAKNNYKPIFVYDEMSSSYLSYAMSVIVSRALPDVRDGLKPVHRRIIYAMYKGGFDWSKQFRKSARIVGDVIGKYHPHGDSAVYDAMVRMAQDFSMRYPIVEGQGNFGSIDGDPPAAMRYTEVRMAKITDQMLGDIEKETVSYSPNYDGSEDIPDVLPTKIPNLLVNGSSGIAVGMATNIPPHNLNEVLYGCINLIKNPKISIDELIKDISGPDFPTGGTIDGKAGIYEAYKTGRGIIHIRSNTSIEEDKSGKQSLIINEIPFMVNKARMLEKIAELVKEKKIEGITEIRDESDKDGLRVVIEVRKGDSIDVLENNIEFDYQKEDLYFGATLSAYDDLTVENNSKYEYILPDIIYDRNLFASNKYGSLDLTSNLNVHNYDTNKFTKFFVNDLDWKYRTNIFTSGLKGNWIGKLKNVNYEAKNTAEYKEDAETELFGALGYLSKIDLFKNDNNNNYLLTPKMLLRYAPGNMRKDDGSFKINNKNIFSLDRLNSYNNFENGLSATVGFDYEVKDNDKEYNFSIGQIVNKKENKDMPSSSSLDEKLSDLVGNANIKINNKLDFNYNFALDQNYKDLNYNEVGFNVNLKPIKFDIDYLQEKKHIGNQEYFKTSAQYSKGDNGLFAFEMKRNIITNSSEYYNLSYEYLNDCLRAGLVYRREFYNDSELEAENSLMFKITLTPFGDITSPSFNK